MAPTRTTLSGRAVLVTAGPTYENIDPVRFIGNRASGRMGFALAEAARDRGAEVTLVAGHASIDPPMGVELARVSTAEDMRRAMAEAAPRADLIVMATNGADGLGERLLGSVTERVVRRAPCAVLAV